MEQTLKPQITEALPDSATARLSQRRWEDPIEQLRRIHSDVELDPIEEAQALAEARQKKAVAIRRRTYWDQVHTEPKYPSYSPEQLYTWAKSRMYEQAGRKLQFEPWRDEALQVLCQYFSDDASFEERGQALGRSWSLEKGILIVGPVGCGKTSMLRLFEMNQKRSFRMFNTLEVYEDIRCQKEKGDRKRLVAQLAGRQPGMHGKVVFGQDYEDVALDDLGTDQACNDYGTSEDFIADLLYKRHEAKLTTHGTSNLVKLDADHFPFRERYGDRLASRFAQMFNMIIFPNDATDLRSL